VSVTDSRAVTSTVAVVFLVAVTVVVAATVSATVFGVGSDLRRPGPTVAESSGDLAADVTGGSDQTVTITHEAGDTLDVSEIEIAVRACGMQGRLVNLPAQGGDPNPTGEYVEGDDLFDNSFNAVTGPIGEDGRTVDGRWTAGETATFRIANGACSLAPGDRATVRVVHEPTGTVVIDETLTAT
jgi:FlaG/FlaF family flagellin (archaellin)